MAAVLDVSEALDSIEKSFPTTQVSRPIDYNVDLGHLAVFDMNNTTHIKTEDDIRLNIRDGIQALINDLWAQPTRMSDDHTVVLATLPEPATIVPREKPLPKIKPPTRWEKFAKEKGIQKTKNTRKVWDEKQSDWIPRFGFKSAANTEDWCIEVPKNVDPMEDQFEKLRNAKKERTEKNKKQQRRNEGVAMASATPTLAETRTVRKAELRESIKTSRVSTASMGRFDKKVKTDGIIKIAKNKRKFDSVTAGIAEERSKASQLLQRMNK